MKARTLVLLTILGTTIAFAWVELRIHSTKGRTVGNKSFLVKKENFVGAIFSAGTPVTIADAKTTTWTPTERDVEEAEDQMVPFLKHAAETNTEVSLILSRLSAYKRQYFGITVHGQKELYINLFCAGVETNWRTQEVFVFDGGPCFFGLQFSKSNHTFSRLRINAQA